MNKLNLKRSIIYLMLVGIIVLVSSCKKENVIVISKDKNVKDYPTVEIITSWNSAVSKIEFAYGEYRPCPITSVIAYTALANYETAIPGMPDYLSIADNYQGLNIPKLVIKTGIEINWPIAINACSAYMYKHFFPKDYGKVAPLEEQLLAIYDKNIDENSKLASIAWGQSVAEAVYNFSKSDLVTFQGYLNLFPTYAMKTTPGCWMPTYPDYSGGKFPQWGKGRTFAITELDKSIPDPIPYSTDKNSLYYSQALEVYNRSTNGSAEDKWIAEFWSDDIPKLTFSPAMRWLEIAKQVFDLTQCNLEKALVTDTKICLALNDAAVACWDQKYKYQVERPVSYIRNYIDPNYKTYLTANGVTPNFPSYPSGHGTFGAAAAEVLTYEFGPDFAMTDRCHEGRSEFNGTPRPFSSFYSMANENAESRIPLGVHFRMDAKESLDLGYRIGRKVNQLPFGK